MLTFAELEFLFQSEPAWPERRAALNGEPPDSQQVLAAGAMSLIVRGLANLSPDGDIVTGDAFLDLVKGLTRCRCPVGISMILGDNVAPGVYCVDVIRGTRTLVTIEAPGLALFRGRPPVRPVVDEAMGLVGEAAAVDGGTVVLKAIGALGLSFRHRGDVWELGDQSRDAEDLDTYFQPSDESAVMAAARRYLTEHLAYAISEVD